jgi:hypothetical protein
LADEGSASTLVLVGAILQLLAMLLFGGLALLFLFGSAFIYMYDPSNPILGFGFGLFWFCAVAAFLGLVFMILWFVWRSHPSRHRTGLILTGVLGLILAGFLPGLLALIGGAIVPSAHKLEPAASQPRATPPSAWKAVNYCPSCGTAITDAGARFCPSCGAPLA